MIKRTWRDPELKWTAKDRDDHIEVGLVGGMSENDLRERLEELDLTEIEIERYDFDAWLERAENARATTLRRLEEEGRLAFNEPVWRDLKMHLFHLFDGKCAYCESIVEDPLSGGEVEHFRPKRGVLGEPDHRGYYWLAYDRCNLLPCCKSCNSARNKANHFPVAGPRATGPEPADAVDSEQPLLLNPLWAEDDVGEHLVFTDQGTVGGRTPEGKRSTKVYHLNRSGLVRRRKRKLAGLERGLATDAIVNGIVPALRHLRNTLESGTEEDSAALLAYYRALRAKMLAELENGG